MKDLLLQNARIIDPVSNRDEIGDIGICGGRFCETSELQNPEVIDLSGNVVTSGLVDVHVHLRDPGQTHKETLESGCAAAAAGGFTSIVAMANTSPAIDAPERLDEIIRRAEGMPVCLLQASAITKGRNGAELVDFAAMKKAGAVAFTDDGSTPQDASVMRKAMARIAELGMVVIDHCEDTAISKPGVMNLGVVSKRLGLPGQPARSETSIVERDIMLCRETGCRVHLQHLSLAESVEMLRAAQKEGLPITGEVTPHHLLLNEEACEIYGTNAKMAPPLRTESDRVALFNELLQDDSAISVIATDHAPHTAEEKAQGWTKAPFGIVGIEAVIPLCLTAFRGKIPLVKLFSYFTKGPRELLGLPIGGLKVGECADVTIIDIDAEHEINVDAFRSKGRNCPYDGWKCKGKVLGTIKSGRLQWN